MGDIPWEKRLTPEQYRVMREKGTEVAHTGKYWDHHEPGIYACAACGNPLFVSLAKFDAKDGWPAFTRPISKHSVEVSPADGAVSCIECESHLGFRKEPKHYCINSIGLVFHALPDIEWEKEDGEAETDAPAQKPASSAKTLTLSIGGLTLGIAIGAGAMSLATPVPVCIAPTTDAQNIASTSPATLQPVQPGTTSTSPAAGGAVKPASTSSAASAPAGSQSPEVKPTTTPATAATSSGAVSTPADGTSAPGTDGTI